VRFLLPQTTATLSGRPFTASILLR
jgi:hypothetical protein